MTVDELQVLITANTNELRKEINKANKNISGLQKSASKSAGGVATAFKKLKTGIVALGIGKVIKDSITSGMDAIESDSLFETSLGKSADAVRSWSDEVSNTLGLNAVAMRKNTGVIYNMTSSMGVAEDNALKMSKGISLLSEDMASFYNLDSAEAFNKLRAGLTGETEPLKALGILVDENTVKQVAYSEGIAQNGAELTQQQKVLARYVAILKQTGNAQGDLARTINSPSNQLRILKQQVTNLGIAFSNFLMPVISAVLPYLTAFTKVVTQALTSLASFLGLSKDESTSKETKKVADNVGGLAGDYDKATKSAKKLKGSLAGFDEMNVLQDKSSESADTSGTGSTATVGVDFDLSEYDAHLDWVDGNTNALVGKIQGMFSSIGTGINFSNLFNAFNNLKTSLAPITTTIFDGLKWAWDNLLVPLAQWTIGEAIPSFMNALSGALDFLNPIISDIQSLIQWLWDSFLEPVAKWTGGIICDVLNGIGDALSWIGQNEIVLSIIEGLAIAIGLVSGALAIWNIAVGVWNSIGAIATAVTSAFGAVMAFVTSPITLITLAIGAVIAIVILLVKNWDKVKETALNVWEGIKNVWNTVATWFSANVIEPVKNFFSGLWEGIKNVFSSVGSWFKEIFSNAWTNIKNAFANVSSFFSGIWGKVKSAFSSVKSWFKEIFSGAWTNIKNAFSGVKKWFSDLWGGIKSAFSSVGTFFKDTFSKAWQSVKNVFSAGGKVFSGIKDGIANTFKSVVNTLISGINKVISVPFNAINKMLNKIRDIDILGLKPFESLWNKDPLSVPQIPKLATGGVIDRPTIAMIGEAGKEAVMPLERNTGWIDQLASKLGDKIGGASGEIKLVVKLGEEAIFDRFIEYGKHKAFETNGEVVFI